MAFDIPSFTDIPWVPFKYTPEQHPGFQYEGFHPGKQVSLAKGHVLKKGYCAFPVDTILETDLNVPMRDGVKLYTNVYRPADGKPQPALIAWSPYGKCAGGVAPLNYDTIGPYRIGIPYDKLSGYETFEGPNPAEWVGRGYVVVDPDARGALHSEGNTVFWGAQEAVDVYDFVEWCTKQSWCDGSVVMFGNSWLAISQINHASRCPHPALKAIAPWEALTDMYKDFSCRGGFRPKDKFGDAIVSGLAGYTKIENTTQAPSIRPLYDDYWESKRIHVENIDLPMYLTGSYSSRLHSHGSFETFRLAKPESTWMRVHATQEWHDLYREETMDDLQKFYDHFAKGKINNGWLQTPHLRLSLLALAGSTVRTVVERPLDVTTFPVPETRNRKVYLDGSNMSLSLNEPCAASTVTYEGHSLTDSISFHMNFDQYTELSGLPWVKLFISCEAHDDMDIHVIIRKTGVNGSLLDWNNYPVPVPVHELPDINICKFQGTNGMLRASHRISQEPKAHEDDYPIITHKKREAIQPGTVVDLEIPIWPLGMVFGAGEGVSLVIAGHDLRLPEMPNPLDEPADENKGKHIVYTGGQHKSFLVLPYLKG